MPHDAFGNAIREGDEVVVRFKVKSITSDAETDQCNVLLEVIDQAKCGGYFPSPISCNAGLVEKLSRADFSRRREYAPGDHIQFDDGEWEVIDCVADSVRLKGPDGTINVIDVDDLHRWCK